MILAKIKNDKGYHSLRIEGHAEYAEYGKDILCAAVSAYAYALLEYCETKQIKLIREEMQIGYAYIVTEDDKVTEPLELIRCGIECIERQYPEHVRVGEEF